MKKKEVTLGDVHELLLEFVHFTTRQFERTERSLDKHTQLITGLSEDMKAVRKDVWELQATTTRLDNEMAMMREDVETIAKTMVKNDKTLKSHSKRLVRLEHITQ